MDYRIAKRGPATLEGRWSPIETSRTELCHFDTQSTLLFRRQVRRSLQGDMRRETGNWMLEEGLAQYGELLLVCWSAKFCAQVRQELCGQENRLIVAVTHRLEEAGRLLERQMAGAILLEERVLAREQKDPARKSRCLPGHKRARWIAPVVGDWQKGTEGGVTWAADGWRRGLCGGHVVLLGSGPGPRWRSASGKSWAVYTHHTVEVPRPSAENKGMGNLKTSAMCSGTN
jgi:hypothetical protein